MRDSFNTLRPLDDAVSYCSLPALAAAVGVDLGPMPVSLKVLLENLVRHEDGVTVTHDDIAALARWPDPVALNREVAFHPARVLMPDSSGVPFLIDLAAKCCFVFMTFGGSVHGLDRNTQPDRSVQAESRATQLFPTFRYCRFTAAQAIRCGTASSPPYRFHAALKV
jgi:hypothetical protein